MNALKINKKKIAICLLLIMLPGCNTGYNISNADNFIYSRKSLISSGKVSITGMSTDAEGNITIKDLNAFHSNGYFSIDGQGQNIKLTKEQYKQLLEK